MTSTSRYRIHPAIGIGRVGNAPASEYFLGPEVPSQRVQRVDDVGTSVPPFKSNGLIKRQAARFRIWEYVETNGVWTPSREVSLADDDVVELTWTVHLANRKASFLEFHGLAGSPQHQVRNDKRRNAGGDPRLLDVDPLPRSIAGRSAGPVQLSKGTSATPDQESWPDLAQPTAITTLGELRTDNAGRLIVIPGEGATAAAKGVAGVHHYANNDGWFDDVGDGPITASLKMRNQNGSVTQCDVMGAWLLVGPPDFAPPLPQVVTLYDVLLDMAARRLTIPHDESVYQTGELARLAALAADLHADGAGVAPVQQLSTYQVDFDTDVAPILRAAMVVTSVFEPAHEPFAALGGTGFDGDTWSQLSDPAHPSSIRAQIFSKLRKPAGFGSSTTWPDTRMPRLLGDDPDKTGAPTSVRGLTLTPTQYVILKAWQDKNVGFTGSKLGPSSLLDSLAAEAITPHGLDRAALENTSGGAFYPGIEVSWLIREPSLFVEPFRIKHGAPSPYLGAGEDKVTVGAGYFSRQMALPWLADFRLCKAQRPDDAHPDDMWGWWPSQRPDYVRDDSGQPVRWHRATGPDGHPRKWASGDDLPSDNEMLGNWWKFGIVGEVREEGSASDWRRFREAERSDTHP